MPTQATVMPSVRITPCGNTFKRASLAPTLKTRRFRRNPAPAAAVSRFRRWWESSARRWMPKQALDPDFVIMARCDLGGVPGASFAEIIERCQAYKAEAQVEAGALAVLAIAVMLWI